MTDSNSYECPIEGCEYGEKEDKTLAQVRGHVNSSGDEDHVWQEAKHELLAEAEKREATTTSENDEDDASGPGVETDDDQSDDGEDSTEMATQEEYEQQYSDEDDDHSEGGETEDQPETGDSEETQGSYGFTIPAVSASTVVLVVGVGVAALLVWRLYSGGDAASEYESPEEQADADRETDGGMAAIEAGTGGVQL